MPMMLLGALHIEFSPFNPKMEGRLRSMNWIMRINFHYETSSRFVRRNCSSSWYFLETLIAHMVRSLRYAFCLWKLVDRGNNYRLKQSIDAWLKWYFVFVLPLGDLEQRSDFGRFCNYIFSWYCSQRWGGYDKHDNLFAVHKQASWYFLFPHKLAINSNKSWFIQSI